MIKRLAWMGGGYVAGAASSWWVSRKVRRTAERVLPQAVRNEVGTRVSDFGDRARTKTRDAVVSKQARRAWERLHPAEVDLRGVDGDEFEPPRLEVLDGGSDSTSSRLRRRKRH